MNYAVVRCVNGAFAVHSEHADPEKTDQQRKDDAYMSFLGYWRALLGDVEFQGIAHLRIVDDQLDTVDDMRATINKVPEPNPEPEEEEIPEEE